MSSQARNSVIIEDLHASIYQSALAGVLGCILVLFYLHQGALTLVKMSMRF
jgi:hypothetical protein